MSGFQLKDKVIVVLSPEGWGAMFLSKHHYAVELARAGNKVYFLNPPSALQGDQQFQINPSGIHPGLFFVEHRLRFPFRLRFHLPRVFHWFMKGHIRKMMNALPARPDIIWSFDLLNLYPLKNFGEGPVKIFHPVDEPLQPAAIAAAKGADVIFAVTVEILQKYQHLGLPAHKINHGVSKFFFLESNPSKTGSNGTVRVGLSGNMLRKDLDRETLLSIMREHSNVRFECWGSYKPRQSNVGADLEDSGAAFIKALEQLPNVALHGPASPEKLAEELHRMDAFLICYDINKDQSKGTNYHKIMEYLATGKVIISNNVTAFKDLPDMVQMTAEREHNKNLPKLFCQVIHNLSEYNQEALQTSRIKFASENTYQNHIITIQKHLSELNRSKTD